MKLLREAELPIPIDLRSLVVGERREGLTYCVDCGATYSASLEACPQCRTRNFWKDYEPVQEGKTIRYRRIEDIPEEEEIPEEKEDIQESEEIPEEGKDTSSAR